MWYVWGKIKNSYRVFVITAEERHCFEDVDGRTALR
jgi:hypothetical protein